jgi:hypothetical protein
MLSWFPKSFRGLRPVLAAANVLNYMSGLQPSDSFGFST